MIIKEGVKSSTLKIEVDKKDAEFLRAVIQSAAHSGDFYTDEIDRLYLMAKVFKDFVWESEVFNAIPMRMEI